MLGKIHGRANVPVEGRFSPKRRYSKTAPTQFQISFQDRLTMNGISADRLIGPRSLFHSSVQQTGQGLVSTLAATLRLSLGLPQNKSSWSVIPVDTRSAEYGTALQKSFFDHFLKGVDNGMEKEPPVILNLRKPFSHDVELRKEMDWPLPNTKWTKIYLDTVENFALPGMSWKPSSN